MKTLENYKWNGFGFPVIFNSLPAIELRGELIPDIDWEKVAKPLIEFICLHQEFSFSGSQVKFIRHQLNMSLREFAKFMGVTHQSVMRWEERKNASAQIEAHIEIFLRLKVLKTLSKKTKLLIKAVERVDDINTLKTSTYKVFKALRVPESVLAASF
jgi:DNA-binding transcriptional regulator YiaG